MKELRKEYGQSKTCVVGANEYIYTIAEGNHFFKGLEIVGQSAMCKLDVQLLAADNSVMAQFADQVNIGKDRHTRLAEGMQVASGLKIKCVLTSTVEEEIGVTFIFNEVQSVMGGEPEAPAVIP